MNLSAFVSVFFSSVCSFPSIHHCVRMTVVCIEVEMKLARRLEAALKSWNQAIVNESSDKPEVDANMDTDAPAQVVYKLGGEPKIKVSIVMNYLCYEGLLF